MRRPWVVALTVAALVPLLVGTLAPASARPLLDRDLVTVREAGRIYPSVKDGVRYRGRFGISAPRSAQVGGRLACDRYKTFRAASRRTSYIYPARGAGYPALDQVVGRFRTLKRAKAVIRHYRKYVHVCRGTHDTTDGEGGAAKMRVRRWWAPRVGDASVGMLDAFIQHGEVTWYRTLVVREGRTVSVQTVEPRSGKGNSKKALRYSRKAIAKLR